MNELNLPIGTALFIDHVENGPESFSCATLIGFLYAQSLIVTLPKRNEYVVQVEKGDRLIVRFSKTDTVYAFSSRVMEINQSPYSYIHLTYPKNIQAKLLRRGNRIDVSKAALQLKIKNNNFSGTVSITNISEYGAKLISSSKLGEVEEKLTIILDLPQYPEIVELNCKICYTKSYADENSNKQSYEHGIEFFEMNTMARSFINHFIHEHIERKKAPHLKIVPNESG